MTYKLYFITKKAFQDFILNLEKTECEGLSGLQPFLSNFHLLTGDKQRWFIGIITVNLSIQGNITISIVFDFNLYLNAFKMGMFLNVHTHYYFNSKHIISREEKKETLNLKS